MTDTNLYTEQAITPPEKEERPEGEKSAERLFTADEVNRIVAERLNKERERGESLNRLKSEILALSESGYFAERETQNGGKLSFAKMASALLEDLDEYKKRANRPSESAAVPVKDPEPAGGRFGGEENPAPRETEDERYGRIILLAEKMGLLNEAPQARAAKNNSLAPSGQARGAEAGQILTERQKQLARAGGMTYGEYLAAINDIPKKKIK